MENDGLPAGLGIIIAAAVCGGVILAGLVVAAVIIALPHLSDIT